MAGNHEKRYKKVILNIRHFYRFLGGNFNFYRLLKKKNFYFYNFRDFKGILLILKVLMGILEDLMAIWSIVYLGVFLLVLIL